ncbi:MAG: alpha-mannosidase [Gaiellaceae bacterium]
MVSPAGYRFFVVPHTHWDREWYLPLEHFRLELAATVDDVLATIEADDRFRCFVLDGQAVLLEDYLDLRPENEGRLRSALASGRLVAGPSYVLPDELLVGGESLVRNLLIGRAVCRRLGAEPSRAGYMPDAFGHPAQLPQLLAGFGIGSLIFSRGVGDEVERTGHTFRWRAPDGSEVVAFSLLEHYNSASLLESAEDLAGRATRAVERYHQELERTGQRDIALCNGSDHLPVQPELPSLLRDCERLLPGTSFRISSFDEYVQAVEASQPKLRRHRGELIGGREQNILRGVNSARIYIKQANERAERLLLEAETAASLATLARGAPYPGDDLRFCWRELLRNHPHDSICGCSVDEVHEDMLERYRRLERTVEVLRRKSLAALGGGGLPLDQAQADDLYRAPPRDRMLVVNPLPWRRRRLLSLALPPELQRAVALEAELHGERLPVQLSGSGGSRSALVAVELDGFEAAALRLRPSSDEGSEGRKVLRRGAGARGGGAAIANERFRVEVAVDGTLTVADLRSGHRVRGLHRLEDEPDLGDLYKFCPLDGVTPWRSDDAGVEVSSRVLREGPLLSELELELVALLPSGLTRARAPARRRARCRIRTTVRLVAGSDRIEFETEVDNRARDHRLRVVFPAPDAGETVRAEGQFALVERPLRRPAPHVEWREPPDATQHTLGATVLGELALFSPGLPEVEARGRPGRAELALTLLRCVGLISRWDGEISTRPWRAGPATATPGGQCPGKHRFAYALRLDAASLEASAVLRAAHDYRHAMLVGSPGAPAETPLSLEGGGFAFSCLKGAEDGDGVVLRLFNPGRERARVRLRTCATVRRARLDEASEETPVGAALSLRPGEIVTLRLR